MYNSPMEEFKNEQEKSDWYENEEKRIRKDLKFKEIFIQGYPYSHPRYNDDWLECY